MTSADDVTLHPEISDRLKEVIASALAPQTPADEQAELRAAYARLHGQRLKVGPLAQAVTGMVFGQELIKRIGMDYVEDFEATRADPLFRNASRAPLLLLQGKPFAAADRHDQTVFHLDSLCSFVQLKSVEFANALRKTVTPAANDTQTPPLDLKDPEQFGIQHALDKLQQAATLEAGKQLNLSESELAKLQRPPSRRGKKPPGYEA